MYDQLRANYLSLIVPQILDSLDRTDLLFRRCLRVFQKICGVWGILPPTYEVFDELSVTTTLPVAFGGFCDVYKGTLSGKNVGIKRLRISATGDRVAVRQVARLCIFGSIVKP